MQAHLAVIAYRRRTDVDVKHRIRLRHHVAARSVAELYSTMSSSRKNRRAPLFLLMLVKNVTARLAHPANRTNMTDNVILDQLQQHTILFHI